MAKVTFASLKLKAKEEVKEINIGDKVVEVKQYLPAEDKYDLLMITLQQAQENGTYNNFKTDVFFHLNVVFMYTNLSFTDKQKEDLLNIYDILESNDIINQIISAIPEKEYSDLLYQLNCIRNSMSAYNQSAAGVINNLISQVPVNMEAAAKIVDNFDPEKYGQVVELAKATGMK